MHVYSTHCLCSVGSTLRASTMPASEESLDKGKLRYQNVLLAALLLSSLSLFALALTVDWRSYNRLDSLSQPGDYHLKKKVLQNLYYSFNNFEFAGTELTETETPYYESTFETISQRVMRSRNSNRHRVNAPQCNVILDKKFDCHPENGITQAKCVARGCCWAVDSNRHRPVNSTDPSDTQAPVDVPYCFYPSNFPTYNVTNITETLFGYTVQLKRTVKSYYPEDIMVLQMDVMVENETRLHIKIFDPASRRYEVPLPTKSFISSAKKPQYVFKIRDDPFAFQVIRASTGTILLDTSDGAFMYANQFIQLSTRLPSNLITGLGEHRGDLMINPNWTRFTLWNKDQHPIEGVNLYGSHPFYLSVEEKGLSHGVFLLNSNAMDVVLQQGSPSPALTWRTIGGILDFFIFLGPGPNDVIRQYTEVIGRSFMPPMWSLGFQLSRFGYKNASHLLSVLKKNRKAGINVAAQWYDIDYMNQSCDFTYDMKNFGDLEKTVWNVRNQGIANVLIVDPGISNKWPPGQYEPYDLGVEEDIFIKDSTGQKDIVGKVWPGNVVFPDFSNPNTTRYWLKVSSKFRANIYFDAFWIDMNEPSNMVTGSVDGCPKDNSLENPPYVPAVRGGSLRFNTLCASAKQHLSSHYDLHNVYGFLESKATHLAAYGFGIYKLPFVLSRSTFAGSGQYAAHWTGDNSATYHDLAASIPAILRMNMFGIPQVGADICGFQGNTSQELCQRWYQLGAFYPFCRSHNSRLAKDQDPTAFGDKMAAAVKSVLDLRYKLLPYLEYLFLRSHLYGDTVARPLFFEFPGDFATYSVNHQFLWGSCLMVSPVVTAGALKVTAYFPAGTWYDYYTGTQVVSKGGNQTLDAPLDKINLHIRAGCMIPVNVMPSLVGTMVNITLIVALNSTGQASGVVYLDDGASPDNYVSGRYRWVNVAVSEQILVMTRSGNGWMGTAWASNIVVYGVDPEPETLLVNGQKVQFTYSKDTKVMSVQLFNYSLDFLTMKWA